MPKAFCGTLVLCPVGLRITLEVIIEESENLLGFLLQVGKHVVGWASVMWKKSSFTELLNGVEFWKSLEAFCGY